MTLGTPTNTFSHQASTERHDAVEEQLILLDGPCHVPRLWECLTRVQSGARAI